MDDTGIDANIGMESSSTDLRGLGSTSVPGSPIMIAL